MRTNKTMRKIMPEYWDDFFKTVSKLCNWGRYFNDGDYRTCVYSPERRSEKVVQVAPRRQKGRDRWNFPEEKRKMLDELFGCQDWVVNFVYITTGLWQGVWVYNWKDLYVRGLLETTVDRNENPYFEIPLHEMYKVCDLWNAPHFCDQQEIYHIVRSQYEYLMKNNPVDKYNDYTDVPDWCLWKWFSPWNGVCRTDGIDDLKAYVKHAKELPSYIEPDVEKTKLPKHEE